MTEESAKQGVFLSNGAYNVLKFIAQILLPGLGTLYFALAGLWNLPKAEEVVGTIMAVDVFLGLLLGLSTKAYNNSDAKYDGSIDVESEDEMKTFMLNLNSDPEVLEEKKEVIFKVNPK